ncbi:hypothetical protein [Paraburkholderia sp. J63]|nr:hypothetical protein [Paraburkholderia sp. J63]
MNVVRHAAHVSRAEVEAEIGAELQRLAHTPEHTAGAAVRKKRSPIIRAT